MTRICKACRDEMYERLAAEYLGHETRRTNPMPSQGLTQAIRLLKAERRKPTDADRPPPSPLPGRKVPYIAGQLSLIDIFAAAEQHEAEEETSHAA